MRIGVTPKRPFDWDTVPNHSTILPELYTNQGMSLNKIAMKFNSSAQSVKNKLVELNVEIRGK